MSKKTTTLTPCKGKGNHSTVHKYDTSAKTQRANILRYFRTVKPTLTVGEAREELGIMAPPARIYELRQQGWHIETIYIREPDSLGIIHRNGLYIFKGRKQPEGASENE